MQGYINKVKYLNADLSEGKIINLSDNNYTRLKIDPEHPSYEDHVYNFTESRFKYPYLPLFMGKFKLDISNVNVNVLRLIIKLKGIEKIALPKELLFLEDFILQNINYHRQFYPMNGDGFIHLTVRTTEKDCYYSNSQTWHIDGFQGSRVDRHIPEQDIIWSNVNPTEFLLQPMFVEGLNPSKHDINQYFEDHAEQNNLYRGENNGVYLLTPYNIHRVSNTEFNEKRVFVRLTFSPVEIEDPTNTLNPMMPRTYAARQDVRNFLWNYEADEIKNSGLVKINL